MSKTNLNMKDLFEVEKDRVPSAKRDALENSRSVEELKKELGKKSKLIKWDVVRDVFEEKAVEMLDLPLLNVFLQSWRKYKEILEFADPEKYPANETNEVSLADHTMKVEHKPYLQVTYRGVPVKKIEFTLEAELKLQAVILRIQSGKIMAIQAGAVTGKGALLLEQKSVMEKTFGSYDLAGSIDLGEGIPLRDAAAAAAS